MTEDQKNLVVGVRAYATDNYNEDGWDFLVECWTDEDILNESDSANTLAKAIKNCRRAVKTLDEFRRSVQNEIF